MVKTTTLLVLSARHISMAFKMVSAETPLVRASAREWLRLASTSLLSEALKVDCKHFAHCYDLYLTFPTLRNLAQVSGGERELRTTYLPAFQYACMESLSIMSAYSSYDGIPAIANSRQYFSPKLRCMSKSPLQTFSEISFAMSGIGRTGSSLMQALLICLSLCMVLARHVNVLPRRHWRAVSVGRWAAEPTPI